MATIPPPDDDVARAVLAKWNENTTLVEYVPGGLQRDWLSRFNATAQPKVKRATPYATFTVKKGQDGIHQSAGDYIDFRRVEIRLFGPHEDVEEALGYIRESRLFNRQTLPTAAKFMACLQVEDDDQTQEEQGKDGEDVYAGKIVLSVMTQRAE